MPNIKNNIDMEMKGGIDELKKEIELREADYAAMSSEDGRKRDAKAAYSRYMRQAEGCNRFVLAIAAGLLVVFAALLGYAVLESINGNMDSAVRAAILVVCSLCVFGITVIIVYDIIKRNAEAKMRLSSHMHRYNMQVRMCAAELEELKAKLSELEKN